MLTGSPEFLIVMYSSYGCAVDTLPFEMLTRFEYVEVFVVPVVPVVPPLPVVGLFELKLISEFGRFPTPVYVVGVIENAFQPDRGFITVVSAAIVSKRTAAPITTTTRDFMNPRFVFFMPFIIPQRKRVKDKTKQKPHLAVRLCRDIKSNLSIQT